MDAAAIAGRRAAVAAVAIPPPWVYRPAFALTPG
jgi:hypothetical protein